MEGLLCDGAAASGMHIGELAPDVGQTGQLGGSIDQHGLVAGIVVHHQVTAPDVQERARVGTGPAGLVVEHYDRRTVVVHTGTIGPEVGVRLLAAARVQSAHRRLVRVQAVMLAQQFSQPVRQRLQGYTDASDPVGQG